MYNYTLSQWLLIFYIYCFLGWCFESVVVSVQQKHLINRGFLRGPMLPIYGFGATIILHVALPLYGHPVHIFFAGMIVATAFEYLVGLIMESLFEIKYWDYSAHRFQFQGRICLQSSVAWGFLSLSLPYLIHKPVEELVTELAPTPTLALSWLLTALFLIDTVTSVKTALDLAQLLRELEHFRAEAVAARDALSALAIQKKDGLFEAVAEKTNILRETVSEKKDELLESAQDTRIAAQRATEAARLQLHLALQLAEDKLEAAAKNLRLDRRLLLFGNPGAVSKKFDLVLRDLLRRLGR